MRGLPILRSFPSVHDREFIVRELAGGGIERVDRTVGAEHVEQPIRTAPRTAPRELDIAQVLDRVGLVLGVDERDAVQQVALVVGVVLVVADHDRVVLSDVGVAHSAEVIGSVELQELAVLEHQCAVLAAEDRDLAGRRALAVDLGALVGDREFVVVIVVRLERDGPRSTIGRADGRDERAVLEHDRDAVVRGLRLVHAHLWQGAVRLDQRVRVEDRRLAPTVGEQDGLVGMAHDVARRIRVEHGVGEGRHRRVEHLKTLRRGDEHVAPVADRVHAGEVVGGERIDEFEGRGIEHAHLAFKRDGDARAGAHVGRGLGGGSCGGLIGGGVCRAPRGEKCDGCERAAGEESVSVGHGVLSEVRPVVMRSVFSRIMER
ncbi:MAG: hypothetical protein ACTIK8_09505 [Microbacterium gubbeenense]|uniref:hypothetical protein n=1 Tax=Microbacterium gubbeenense TaxID=159896 RepID=UPI003F947943